MKDLTQEQKKEVVELLKEFAATKTVQAYHCCSGDRKYVAVQFAKKKGLLPELEIDKWYKDIFGSIVKYQGLLKTTYGIDYLIGWQFRDDWNFSTKPENWTLLTEREVFEALKAEALKRGFKEGAYFVHNTIEYPSLRGEEPNIINTNMFNYENGTLGMGGWGIYSNGNWAEIASQPETVMTISELEEKHGYTNLKIVK